MTRPCHQRAFTLIELVIYIVVVSVGLAGVLAAFKQSVRQSADPLVWKQALLVAEGMMNEILGKDFQASENITERANFNNVSDYHGFATTGILASDGATAIPGLSNYTIAVAVTDTDFSGTNAADATIITIPGGSAKRITVTVACGNQSISLAAFRTGYGL